MVSLRFVLELHCLTFILTDGSIAAILLVLTTEAKQNAK